MERIVVLRKRIKIWTWIFIFGLLLSGFSAIPVEWGLNLIHKLFIEGGFLGKYFPHLTDWLNTVRAGVHDIGENHPYFLYALDWLAFAHFIIAAAFIGLLRDPVRNIWITEFGMIACVLVLPLAFIMGPIRGIPWFWMMIDSCFGFLGIIPLIIVRRMIKELEVLTTETN